MLCIVYRRFSSKIFLTFESIRINNLFVLCYFIADLNMSPILCKIVILYLMFTLTNKTKSCKKGKIYFNEKIKIIMYDLFTNKDWFI